MHPDKNTEPPITFLASTVLADGTIVELIHNGPDGATQFACYKDGEITYTREVILSDGTTAIPFSSRNSLLRSRVVLFPFEPTDYGTTPELVNRVRAFVRNFELRNAS